MKKDVMIALQGIQKIDGEAERIDLLTCGRFYKKNGSYWLSYDETESTGFAGHRTTLRVEDGKVTMMRHGPAASQLIIEAGVRHQCSYNTGYGVVMMGVSGGKIRNTLTDDGGSLEFSYDLDLDTVLAAENQIKIRVEEDKAATAEG